MSQRSKVWIAALDAALRDHDLDWDHAIFLPQHVSEQVEGSCSDRLIRLVLADMCEAGILSRHRGTPRDGWVYYASSDFLASAAAERARREENDIDPSTRGIR